MCTLTYLPQPNGQTYLLTVNRDESIQRPTAARPALYHLKKGKAVVFPRDGESGGTWIAFDNNRAVCLLNGAFVCHQRKKLYRRSRGLVLLDSFNYTSIISFVKKYNFSDIEPFTIVCLTHNDKQNELCEIRWDGDEVHFQQIDPTTPQIWSSATLYSPETAALRKQWFDAWVDKQNAPFLAEDIVHFHKTAGDGNPMHNLLFDKQNGLKTLSITQIVKDQHTTLMHYWEV